MARETLIYGGLENEIIIVKLDADCSQDIHIWDLFKYQLTSYNI